MSSKIPILLLESILIDPHLNTPSSTFTSAKPKHPTLHTRWFFPLDLGLAGLSAPSIMPSTTGELGSHSTISPATRSTTTDAESTTDCSRCTSMASWPLITVTCASSTSLPVAISAVSHAIRLLRIFRSRILRSLGGLSLELSTTWVGMRTLLFRL